MPPWLLWLSGIPLATVGAILWASWSNRPRGPEKAVDSVQAYEKFRAALTVPVPGPRPAPRARERGRR